MLLIDPADWPTLQRMMQSLVSNIAPLQRFVEAICYLAGFFYAFKACYILKEYGEMRTMMSSQTDMRRPLLLFLVAGGLLYLPQLYHMGIITLFDQYNPSPLAYPGASYATWQGVSNVIAMIIQLLGLISFARGWFVLSALSGHSAPPGTVGKGMWHIIGGILAINIIGTQHVIESTLGITVS